MNLPYDSANDTIITQTTTVLSPFENPIITVSSLSSANINYGLGVYLNSNTSLYPVSYLQDDNLLTSYNFTFTPINQRIDYVEVAAYIPPPQTWAA